MDPIKRGDGPNHPASLWLSREHWAQMAADVGARYPEEACGLVASQAGRTVAVFPVANQLRSPVRFRMEPRQQVKAYFEILERGWELAAIYHSHPDGPEIPSQTDVAEHAYPEAIALIWSRQGGKWSCKGFRIQAGQIDRVRIRFFSRATFRGGAC